jgi:hypothetical protein
VAAVNGQAEVIKLQIERGTSDNEGRTPPLRTAYFVRYCMMYAVRSSRSCVQNVKSPMPMWNIEMESRAEI